MSPRSTSRSSSCSRVVLPRRISAEMRTMSTRTIRLRIADDPQERARDARADHAAVVWNADMCELTVRAATARTAASANTIVECPSEKKNPTPIGRLPVCEHLARRVVDRRDVVGVERVSQAEAVGEDPEAGQRGITARVVEEEPPPGDVQQADGAPEPGQPPPLVSGHRSRPGPASHPILPATR